MIIRVYRMVLKKKVTVLQKALEQLKSAYYNEAIEWLISPDAIVQNHRCEM